MRASCVICSDLFDDHATAVSAPCGHVFHDYCMFEWMGRSKTCPECRNKVTDKTLTRLYFNIAQHAESQSCLENQLANLQAKIGEKDIQLGNLRQEKKEIQEYVRVAEKKAASLEQDVYKLQSESTSLRMVVKDLKKKADNVEALQAVNRSLISKIETLQNVELVVNGTQKDVDDILDSMSNEPGSSRSIATYCSLLKRELKRAMDSKHSLQNEIASLRRTGAAQSVKITQLNDKVKQMSEQNVGLENENLTLLARLESMKSAPSCSSANSADAAVVTYESPAPERLKSTEVEEITATPEVLRNTTVGVIKRKLVRPAAYEHTVTVPIKSARKLNIDVNNDLSTILKNRNTLEKSNENSSIRNGYNGLGGHSKFIQRSLSNAKFKPPSKR